MHIPTLPPPPAPEQRATRLEAARAHLRAALAALDESSPDFDPVWAADCASAASVHANGALGQACGCRPPVLPRGAVRS